MSQRPLTSIFFFFNDTATTEIYTLSLHDALPIFFILALFRLLINLEETFKLEHRTGHAEVVSAIGDRVDIDGGLIEDSRQHLRSDKTLPNELVNLVLILL